MGTSRAFRRGLGALALTLVAGALAWVTLGGNDDPGQDLPDDPPPPTTAEMPTTTPDPADVNEAAAELVDSVMLVGFEGTSLDGETRAALEEHPPGGVLIGPENWANRRAGRSLISEIRKAAPDALIVTRQEGGPYRALADLPPEEREIEIGDEADPKLAERWASSTAEALADAGIDVNLAPVADVATLDSPIADRAFGDDPGVAAEMTAIAIEECDRAGIACAPAHFPGLGAGTGDTDQGPSSVSLDPATLRSRDLVPFEAAFDAGAPAVVISNGLYVAYDPVTPAALAPDIATGLLRDEFGFEGAAISDDISAGAVSAFAKPGDAAIAAMDAGIDLVQVADPGAVEGVRESLENAAGAGLIGETRLRQAAENVAALGGQRRSRS